MTSIPWLFPGMAAALVVAVLVSGRVADVLRADRRVAIALVTAVGLIAVATLTPTRLRLELGFRGSGVCDLTRFDPPRIDEWLALADPALNVLLFVPLGVAIACLPRSRRTLAVAVAAAALPLAIELVQLVVQPLGRGCQSADAVDNVLGLLIGLAGGSLIVAALRRRSGR